MLQVMYSLINIKNELIYYIYRNSFLIKLENDNNEKYISLSLMFDKMRKFT